ncbi:TetR/AcrR family transcriptional regulator [Actinospica robiniae]|uniref:TetR/AcrR family transcriptional regulator n=1 Tax=Actinospica robiniae TaxID=304901 RepID=UPI0003FEBB43|nr:TetR/AcrR family transcriptional regulator [Actinospica robiniae]
MSKAEVIAEGAALADDVGFAALAMAPLAQRLGVRPPSLYKHVAGLAELQHGIATLAITELDRSVRVAVHGLSGPDALAALIRALRDYALAHPGRYAATIGEKSTGPNDPLLCAGNRIIEVMTAVLRGYRLGEDDMVHALRLLRCVFHGFALLELGQGFRRQDSQESSFAWMMGCLDRGLASRSQPASPRPTTCVAAHSAPAD